ncbi:Translocation protein S62 [Microsporum canis]|uniref:Translocation protein SEC62 n=1 Tax=Arthroderma otae (strain ATCC MYA-4605 / CBS 113480) TaxID=554155 RepID=C5FNF0_ARTOC|nr:translocation protein SEC62 [Microsporum canis CBS 113480]EEQ31564.1 translocation protein SEC62 [Microsporum canis CBS 113480]
MAAPGPTPEQIAMMQQQMAAEAQRRGMTVEEFGKMQREQIAAEAARQGLTTEQFIHRLKAQALRQHQMQQQQQQQQQEEGQQGQQQPQHQHQQHQHPQQQQQQQQVPVNSAAPPDPRGIAVAQFLKAQNLKPRVCILDGRRKELFKVKRALRALQSPAYAKASAKPKSNLPPVTDLASAENAFRLLPMSLLALKVSKIDPHEGYNHAKPPSKKGRVKGLWTVRIQQHQDTNPMSHYVWLYEGPQWKQKAMAAGVLAAIMAVVMFPLWPVMLRQGVWYLSVGMMGLLCLFFAMAIFRLILFAVTFFVASPGLWLFPNLFEDVGFFESFVPVWGWQETKKKKRSKKTDGSTSKSSKSKPSKSTTAPAPSATEKAPATANPPAPAAPAEQAKPEHSPARPAFAASVEDAEEE